MKRVVSLCLAVFMLLSLCACGNDVTEEDIIVGTWKSTSYKGADGWYPIEDEEFRWQFTFDSNGKAEITLGGVKYPRDLTWVFDGSDDDSISYAILNDGEPLSGVVYSKELGVFVYDSMIFEKAN